MLANVLAGAVIAWALFCIIAVPAALTGLFVYVRINRTRPAHRKH
jgi:hypothetical protein